MLVFSYEVNKPKAFAPIPFLVAIGVGMAAETLVTMGVKAGSKAILKKQAYNYSEDIQRAGKFDWAGTNPYRNKDGSITLSPTANDRAKMAGLIAGSLAGSLAFDEEGGYSCPPTTTNLLSYRTTYPPDTHASAYAKELAKISLAKKHLMPYLEQQEGVQTVFRLDSAFTGQRLRSHVIPSTYSDDSIYLTVDFLGDDDEFYVKLWGKNSNGVDATISTLSGKVISSIPSNFIASETISNDLGFDYLNCEGLYVPTSVDRVYPAPMDMSSTYKMPNHSLLENKPFIINNIMPVSEDEGYVTWEEIQQYLDENGKTIEEVMEVNIENYAEQGDININPITLEEIENIYTDINQEEKVEDFNPPTGELPVPVPDGGDLTPVEPIDRSILQVMKESYSYLADSIDTAIEAMKNITDGATGIVNYLDQAFRWLPAEWRALFGAAFILGVFAHFFRR